MWALWAWFCSGCREIRLVSVDLHGDKCFQIKNNQNNFHQSKIVKTSSKGHITKRLREFGQVSVYKGQDTHINAHTRRDNISLPEGQKLISWVPRIVDKKEGIQLCEMCCCSKMVHFLGLNLWYFLCSSVLLYVFYRAYQLFWMLGCKPTIPISRLTLEKTNVVFNDNTFFGHGFWWFLYCQVQLISHSSKKLKMLKMAPK